VKYHNCLKLFQIQGPGPPDGVTTVNDVSPCSVPSRSVITRRLQNVTLGKLLVLVSVDNKTPNATTFGKYLDVFGTRLVGQIIIEPINHFLIDVAEDAPAIGRSTTCSPLKIVLFDVRNQGSHFVVHIDSLSLLIMSYYRTFKSKCQEKSYRLSS